MVLGEIFRQSVIILRLILPTIGLLIILLGVFYAGRFSGKYHEQKDIVKNMPQPFVNEVQDRDKIIMELTTERDQLLQENIEHRVSMKAMQEMARKIESQARGTTIKVLPLEARPVKLKAIQK